MGTGVGIAGSVGCSVRVLEVRGYGILEGE